MSGLRPPPRFFYRLTNGIRITVRPEYLAARSDPTQRRFVFAYHVRIENVDNRSARLISRKWLIHDEIGEDVEVEGEGVVGEQPVIGPGEVHEYQSFIVLKAPSGYMEGSYRFIRADGSAFEAEIPRFALIVAELGAG
ncbi:MAG TPA: Co2+/Mg2+ efflux protein ApaG [Gemmatimonadales bacterium]|nr:Co2+/Mg2+ efflux protein ApaG [Gemmatimonadales bacterium]